MINRRLSPEVSDLVIEKISNWLEEEAEIYGAPKKPFTSITNPGKILKYIKKNLNVQKKKREYIKTISILSSVKDLNKRNNEISFYKGTQMNDEIKGQVCANCSHCSMTQWEYICKAPQLDNSDPGEGCWYSDDCRGVRANKNLCTIDGKWFLSKE